MWPPFHYTRIGYQPHRLLHDAEEDHQSIQKVILLIMNIASHRSGMFTYITICDIL